MGYALEYARYIDTDDLKTSEFAMNGKTTSQMMNYIKGKANAWMTTNLGNANFGTISGYDSDIQDGWFRVVLRVGFIDENNNHVFDIGELWDYHWWYQTKTGNWADKLAWLPSQLRQNTAGVDPAGLTWQNGDLFYNSYGQFYEVHDIRNIDW